MKREKRKEKREKGWMGEKRTRKKKQKLKIIMTVQIYYSITGDIWNLEAVMHGQN